MSERAVEPDPDAAGEAERDEEPRPAGVGAGAGEDLETLRRRVGELERANEELRRANLALARERLGRSDAAAASAIHRATTAERALLRSQGWDEWPLALRVPVAIALRLRRLKNRVRRR